MRKKRAVYLKSKTLRSKDSTTKLAILALSLVLGLVILGKIIFFVTSLGKPLNLYTEKKYQWDTSVSFNIVLALLNRSDEPEIGILHFDPGDKKLVVLATSKNTYMELPKGFGSWRVGSIYGLGQEENPPQGAKLLRQSVSKLTGLPIDGIVVIDRPGNGGVEEFVNRIRKSPFEIVFAFGGLKTDLTPLDGLQALMAISSVRGDKVDFLDLEKSEITQSELLPDSSRVLGVDSVKLDLFIRGNMADAGIISEGTSVGVYNATPHPGLASFAARMITNLGGNVVIVTNTEDHQQNSMVLSEKNTSKIFKKLVQVYAPSCIKQCIGQNVKIISSRAQVNVILGEDFYKEWYQR